MMKDLRVGQMQKQNYIEMFRLIHVHKRNVKEELDRLKQSTNRMVAVSSTKRESSSLISIIRCGNMEKTVVKTHNDGTKQVWQER